MSNNAVRERRSARKKDARGIDPRHLEPIQDQLLKKEGIRRIEFGCRSEAQGHYLTLIQSKRIVFGEGPAGVGKTVVAGHYAAKCLKDKEVQRIVITRPVVSAEEELGYLKGDMLEKTAPYFITLRDLFAEWFGYSHVDLMIKDRIIEIAPLAYMRGRTFDNAIVILDEAQNTTAKQMKLFLTRLGKHSKMLINGDVTQIDIDERSGLVDALSRFKDMSDSAIYRFTEEDVVRDPLVREILMRYRDA